MSTTFPRTKKSARGYRVEQVEEFLEEARAAYGAPPEASPLTAEAIRRASFGFERGGYSTSHVDAALERLEDAFASRERDGARRVLGDEEWFNRARSQAKELVDRLSRPSGKKFARVSFLSKGYEPKGVDAFSAQLLDYFQRGVPLSVEQVRTVAFRPKRGGYREAQVDFVLDAVIDVMLAVR